MRSKANYQIILFALLVLTSSLIGRPSTRYAPIMFDDLVVVVPINNSSASEKQNYAGAANVGDFAKLSFDTETNILNYSMSGNVFGEQSGSLQLTNAYGNFYYDDNHDLFFFSGSLGVAVMEVDDNITFVSGLQMEGNVSIEDVINKRYIFVIFLPNKSGGFSAKLDMIDINATTGDTNGTWSELFGKYGNWELSEDHIVIYNHEGDKTSNVVLRSGSSRVGFLMDVVDGGFGIGVEAKALTAADGHGTFKSMDHSFIDNSNCFGETTLAPDTDGNVTFTWVDKYCQDENGNMQPVDPEAEDSNGTGRLLLNPTVTINGNPVTLTGAACVADENNSSQCSGIEFAFFDPEDGYFITVNTGDDEEGTGEPMVGIGSNK